LFFKRYLEGLLGFSARVLLIGPITAHACIIQSAALFIVRISELSSQLPASGRIVGSPGDNPYSKAS